MLISYHLIINLLTASIVYSNYCISIVINMEPSVLVVADTLNLSKQSEITSILEQNGSTLIQNQSYIAMSYGSIMNGIGSKKGIS
jgi:hypothetical protein